MTRLNDSYTVKELRETAKIYNIKNVTKLNKAELCSDIIKRMTIVSCELTCEVPEVEPQQEVLMIADLENCDNLQELACSLTSEIDQNPLWESRTCELPEISYSDIENDYYENMATPTIDNYNPHCELPVLTQKEQNLVYWMNWDSAYWKALEAMRKGTNITSSDPTKTSKPPVKTPESFVMVALLMILVESLIKTVILIVYLTYTVLRETQILSNLMWHNFKSAVSASKRFPKLA